MNYISYNPKKKNAKMIPMVWSSVVVVFACMMMHAGQGPGTTPEKTMQCHLVQHPLPIWVAIISKFKQIQA